VLFVLEIERWVMRKFIHYLRDGERGRRALTIQITGAWRSGRDWGPNIFLYFSGIS